MCIVLVLYLEYVKWHFETTAIHRDCGYGSCKFHCLFLAVRLLLLGHGPSSRLIGCTSLELLRYLLDLLVIRFVPTLLQV